MDLFKKCCVAGSIGLIGVILTSLTVNAMNGQLKSPLDRLTKTLISEVVREEMDRAIFDVAWKKLFMWETFFESLDGFQVDGATLDSDNLVLATSGALNDTSSAKKFSIYSRQFEFFNRSAFRSGFQIDSVSNVEAWISTGYDPLLNSGSGYGFKILNSTLYGFTSDGSTVNTVQLETINTDDYRVQAEYYPGERVVFLTSKTGFPPTEKGVSVSNLPDRDTLYPQGNGTPFMASVKATAAAVKTFNVTHFQYMQSRNLTR